MEADDLDEGTDTVGTDAGSGTAVALEESADAMSMTGATSTSQPVGEKAARSTRQRYPRSPIARLFRWVGSRIWFILVLAYMIAVIVSAAPYLAKGGIDSVTA